jgi:hypothetical protein
MNVFGLNEALTTAEAKDLRKADLKNLLTSYADEADVFAEIIQNAFDSVSSGISSSRYRNGEVPRINIFIGRRLNDTHYFAVNDNGMGMDPDVVKKFTIPGYSHLKKMGKTIGYKGVGASFFFASSQRISVAAQNARGEKSAFSVRGSFGWIMNETEPEPTVSDAADFPEAVASRLMDEQGATICYYLHSAAKPKTLNNIAIVSGGEGKELSNWVSFLCSKTALGQLDDISSKGIHVTFVLDTGSNVTEAEWTFGSYNKEERKLGYPFPWKVFAVHQERSAIDATQPAQHFKHKNKHQAIHSRWSKSEIAALGIDFDEEESNVVQAHLDSVDLFFAYSTDVLREVHDRLGTRSTQIRYGVRIAVDGVPQGRMLDFDLTRDSGLNRQAHAVVAFSGLALDTGRKIPANETVAEVIRKIGVRVMSIIAEYRWTLRKKDRPPFTSDLEEWKNNIRALAVNSTVRQLFEVKGLTPPITIEPDSENDVLCLFAACLSSGLLKGYKLHALSGHTRYDGLCDILDGAEFRDTNDPFSIRDTDRLSTGSFKVVEFKQQFADLLDDFESRKKNPSEIDLAICWSLPTLSTNRGQIAYCYADRKDHRPFYGVTHIWSDENDTSVIPIICLRTLIAELLKISESTPGLGHATYTTLLQQDKDGSV